MATRKPRAFNGWTLVWLTNGHYPAVRDDDGGSRLANIRRADDDWAYRFPIWRQRYLAERYVRNRPGLLGRVALAKVGIEPHRRALFEVKVKRGV